MSKIVDELKQLNEGKETKTHVVSFRLTTTNKKFFDRIVKETENSHSEVFNFVLDKFRGLDVSDEKRGRGRPRKT